MRREFSWDEKKGFGGLVKKRVTEKSKMPGGRPGGCAKSGPFRPHLSRHLRSKGPCLKPGRAECNCCLNNCHVLAVAA